MRRESFKFWDLVRLILETLRYVLVSVVRIEDPVSILNTACYSVLPVLTHEAVSIPNTDWITVVNIDVMWRAIYPAVSVLSHEGRLISVKFSYEKSIFIYRKTGLIMSSEKHRLFCLVCNMSKINATKLRWDNDVHHGLYQHPGISIST